MTEDDARAWLDDFGVSPEQWQKLELFVGLLLQHGEAQNLIARSTRAHIWSRHIVDSAQLLPLVAGRPHANWLDLGSGAGLPGLVTAVLSERPTTLLEPRALRVTFLTEAVARVGLQNQVKVAQSRAETFEGGIFSVISARAFAPLHRLFAVSHKFSSESTIWLLPKGANAAQEVTDVTDDWRGVFHVKQSVTDFRSGIVVAQGVARR